MPEAISRSECVLATGNMTEEAEQIVQQELTPEADQYELAVLVCREKACVLSLEDYMFRIIRYLFSANPKANIKEEIPNLREWLPPDCPLLTGQLFLQPE